VAAGQLLLWSGSRGEHPDILPPGVLNVVNGGKQTVEGLLTHPDVRAILFVGSNSAGEYIHEVDSKNGKRVQAN